MFIQYVERYFWRLVQCEFFWRREKIERIMILAHKTTQQHGKRYDKSIIIRYVFIFLAEAKS